MTGKRRVPLGSKAQREALAASERKEAARAAKRGLAVERAAREARLLEGVDRLALEEAMQSVLAAREEAEQPRRRGRPRARDGARADGPEAAADAALAFPAPASFAGRWVPIGPSVVRRGQAVDRPRVAGRIRDIAVDPTGRRAYAATAQGGVWYTDDGGASWVPVGGWSERRRVRGGAVNAQACGCLLVDFDAMPLLDTVLVGTGEPNFLPANFVAATGEATINGVGVLAAIGPTFPPGQAEPWEPDTGIAALEGLGIFRLLRSPASTAGDATPGATQDVVIACTTNGAFLGRRQSLPASGGNPVRDGYVWTPLAAVSAAFPNTAISDGVWLPGGRLVLAVAGRGLVFSDNAGTAVTPLPLTNPVPITGYLSLAATGNTVYALGETGGNPALWRVADATVAAPTADDVGTPGAAGGVPPTLWNAGSSQRDYDQCIAVDTVGAVHRVYLGGSSLSYGPADGDWGASLYCFDVAPSGVAAPPFVLQPTVGVSSAAALPAGDGATVAGAIGNNVHGDVHRLVLTGNAPPRRQVWAATDGGVFVSDRSGRVGTFAACNTGLASLQPVFVRGHPVNGHVVATGCQDNGSQVRIGDSVWDEPFTGDGGGVAFHPTASHLLVRQFNASRWYCTSRTAFVDPMTRNPGEPSRVVGPGVEGSGQFSAFYSGAATVRVPPIGPNPATGRLAIGTYRVWLTDDLGVGVGPNTWRTIPYPNGAVQDGRPGVNGAANNAQLAIGFSGLGRIITLTWVSPTQLLVLYTGGIVRFTEAPAGTWASTTWSITNVAVAIPRTTTLTDIAAVPGTQDFYVATTGVVGGTDETLWYYSNADGRFHRTTLRRQLDNGGSLNSGPRDPVFSVVVDPGDATGNTVYAGTVTGVWRGTRTSNATGAHNWAPYVNGLPQATVQDLDIWRDPGGALAAPRLMRAAVQSRGVWEVDLARDAVPQTWIRSTRFDDRRNPLTIHPDPMAAPPRVPASLSASPDITVRPRWPVTATPAFLAGPAITALNAPAYDVWTFQTAFRWLYPSVVANGIFSDALGRLVALHRTQMAPAKSAVPQIDAAVWTDVLTGVRVKADGTVTNDTADPRAVYRAPWQTSRAPTVTATEADLMDLVPRNNVDDMWTVFREPSTVDVLVHHRDAIGLRSNQAFVVLVWRVGATPGALLAESVTTLLPFLTAAAAGTVQAVPGGWNLASGGGGVNWRTVPTPVDARMPRAVSIDVDLSAVPNKQQVLFLAFVGSLGAGEVFVPPTTSTAGVVPPTTVAELVRFCPYAAARIVHIEQRPT
jgi:hypothetical protein